MKLKWSNLLPRTLVSQMLLIILASSLIPLIVLGLLNGQTTRAHFEAFSRSQLQLIERQYIDLYESYLTEQVNVIDAEMRKVESAVLSVQAQAETIYTHPERYMTEAPPFTQRKNGYWYTRMTPVDGVGYQNLSSATMNTDISRDLSLSTWLNPSFRSESDRNPNILGMYFIHPMNAYNYYTSTAKTLGGNNSTPFPTLSSLPYYRDALGIQPGEHRVAWTKPYHDVSSNNIYMFTATAPVYESNSHLKGVVAADISIQDFVENIVDEKFNDAKAFAMLLDTDRNLIATQQRGEEAYARMAANGIPDWDPSARYIEYLNGEQTEMLFMKSVPSTGWTLAYVIPKEELLREFTDSSAELSRRTNEKLIQQNVWITLFTAMICILLTLLLGRRIMRPIQGYRIFHMI